MHAYVLLLPVFACLWCVLLDRKSKRTERSMKTYRKKRNSKGREREKDRETETEIEKDRDRDRGSLESFIGSDTHLQFKEKESGRSDWSELRDPLTSLKSLLLSPSYVPQRPDNINNKKE